ncbi:putative capsular polysaccharide biosynthesis protein [Magnetofaba australis IT-1]|uniref:non-specific protein-tyrosine kinase n=2 Tax=Magnetofaba TaxID=1472292 RepID=A0A1Y2KBB4_9PROT|nr:putative capsular polysaccharide biosynthesis protein [Magnetofaba australis IT-1]
MRSWLRRSQGALAGVKASLRSVSREEETRSVLVASSVSKEGASTTAVSMAYALAALGRSRVLLVDGNYDAPQLHQLFNLPIGPGFSDVVTRDVDPQSVIHASEFKGLDVMTSGSAPDRSLDVFESDQFDPVIDALEQSYDYLIMDCAPFLKASDTLLAAQSFDGVILTIRCESTKREVVNLVQSKIAKVGGDVLGVVLNRRRFYLPRFLYGWL